MNGQSLWNPSAIEQPRFHTSLLGPLESVSAPSAQIVTVADAKIASRITQSAEDSLISDLIGTATQFVEREAGRDLRPATYDLPVIGFWCGLLKLPRPPLASVTSVKYFDTAGVEQTLDSSIYVVRTPIKQPGYIERAPLQVWPAVQYRAFPITIRFVCGYATASVVPMTYKRAIYLLVGHYYEHREAATDGTVPKEISLGVKSLIEAESWGSYA